jgi:hypothetical protein
VENMPRIKKVKEVKEVNEIEKDLNVAEDVLAPLPDAEDVKAVEVKEVKAKKAKVWYGACRISGGLRVDILVDGEQKKIMFRSANKSRLGADGTRTFEFNPDQFGIIELTEEEAKACIEALKPMNCYKRGFVIISDDMEKIKEIEKSNVANFPQQGTEQELALKGAVVNAFDEEN